MLKAEVKQIYKDYSDALTCSQINNLSITISNIIFHDFVIDEPTSIYIDIQSCNNLFNSWHLIDDILNHKQNVKILFQQILNYSLVFPQIFYQIDMVH